MVEDVTEMMQQAKGGREYRCILRCDCIPWSLRHCNRGRERRLLSSFRRRIFGQPDMLRFPDDGIQQHTELFLLRKRQVLARVLIMKPHQLVLHLIPLRIARRHLWQLCQPVYNGVYRGLYRLGQIPVLVLAA